MTSAGALPGDRVGLSSFDLPASQGLVGGMVSGRGAAWLARCNGVAEVGGSNPLAPTIWSVAGAVSTRRAPVFLAGRDSNLRFALRCASGGQRARGPQDLALGVSTGGAGRFAKPLDKLSPRQVMGWRTDWPFVGVEGTGVDSVLNGMCLAISCQRSWSVAGATITPAWRDSPVAQIGRNYLSSKEDKGWCRNMGGG